jgi:hypothetical protein
VRSLGHLHLGRALCTGRDCVIVYLSMSDPKVHARVNTMGVGAVVCGHVPRFFKGNDGT